MSPLSLPSGTYDQCVCVCVCSCACSRCITFISRLGRRVRRRRGSTRRRRRSCNTRNMRTQFTQPCAYLSVFPTEGVHPSSFPLCFRTDHQNNGRTREKCLSRNQASFPPSPRRRPNWTSPCQIPLTTPWPHPVSTLGSTPGSTPVSTPVSTPWLHPLAPPLAPPPVRSSVGDRTTRHVGRRRDGFNWTDRDGTW